MRCPKCLSYEMRGAKLPPEQIGAAFRMLFRIVCAGIVLGLAAGAIFLEATGQRALLISISSEFASILVLLAIVVFAQLLLDTLGALFQGRSAEARAEIQFYNQYSAQAPPPDWPAGKRWRDNQGYLTPEAMDHVENMTYKRNQEQQEDKKNSKRKWRCRLCVHVPRSYDHLKRFDSRFPLILAQMPEKDRSAVLEVIMNGSLDERRQIADQFAKVVDR